MKKEGGQNAFAFCHTLVFLSAAEPVCLSVSYLLRWDDSWLTGQKLTCQWGTAG